MVFVCNHGKEEKGKKYWSQSRHSQRQLTDSHLTLPGFTLFYVVALFQTPSPVHILKFNALATFAWKVENAQLRPWETQKTFDIVY